MQQGTNQTEGYNAPGSRYVTGGSIPSGGMQGGVMPSGTVQPGSMQTGGVQQRSLAGAASLAQNVQQLTYEQFQEQARLRQEQEQEKARMALISAGADRHSDKIRSVIQHLQGLNSEIQRAENQIQVQMDAQLRQIQLIQQRVLQAESMMQQLINGPAIRQ